MESDTSLPRWLEHGETRVLIRVLHIFGRMARAGAQARTVELMPLLAEMGVRCDFCTLTPEAGLLDPKIRAQGGEIYACPLRPALLSFPRRFRRVLRRTNSDVVHSHVHYASGYVVRLAHHVGVRGRVVHFRTTGDDHPNTWRRTLYRRVMRKLADRHATAVVAVSQAAMQYSWGPQWRSDPRARVIYNGLDLSPFQQVATASVDLRTELKLPRDSKLIINVGRIDPPKAHDMLLEAAAQAIVKDARLRFLLVGDGELRQAMERKTRELGIDKHVCFLGARDDVPRLLMGSDWFVLSSRREGLPGVVLEAIAAQLPVIATDLPGVREIAEHTDLITMVPVEKPGALAQALLNAVACPDRSARPTSPFPPAFDLRRCAENVHAMYLQAIEGWRTL